MKIIKLEAENIKRLTAVSITPQGNMIVIGGDNEQGKTSVLDAIEYAINNTLDGARYTAEELVHEGADKGKVTLDLGDIIVRRITTKGGTRLSVESKDGAVYKSPQTMLDSLMGKISFDPLEFSRMKPDDQVETLRTLVGLDFTALDQERAEKFADRTVLNRDIKALEARIAAIPEVDAPDEEVSVAELTLEMEEAMAGNKENQDKRDGLQKAKNFLQDQYVNLHEAEMRLELAKKEVQTLESEITARTKGLDEIVGEINKAEKEVSLLEDTMLDGIREQIATAEETNRKVRDKKARAELTKEVGSLMIQSENLTKRIEDIDTTKETQLKEAPFPIKDLSFNESGVTYQGKPFSVASGSGKLKVSAAIGFALNPKIKVLLIRDGSLLDENNLKLLAEMAEKEGGQVWIERVGKDKNVQVLIEDGMVKE